MSDYSFKIEEIQNPTIDPAVPNPYGAKSFETVKYHTPITQKKMYLDYIEVKNHFGCHHIISI